jgi:hypothetical protein
MPDTGAILQYLGDATAAGILGNAAYDEVQRLGIWARSHLGWNPPVELAASSSEPVTDDVDRLFELARAQWSPAKGGGNQTVIVGRDVNAPIINRSTGSQGW